MKKAILWTMMLVFAFASCSKSPEDRVEDVIDDFADALCDNEFTEAERFYPNCSFVNNNVNSFDFKDLKRLKINSISKVKSKKNLYEVASTCKDKEIKWVVYADNSKAKVMRSFGLYGHDVEKMQSKIGCKISIPLEPTHTDVQNSAKWDRCVNAMDLFKDFAKALQKSDSSRVASMFPHASKYLSNIKLGKQLNVKSCQYFTKENIVFECDSISIRISPEEKNISDTRNLLNPPTVLIKKLQDLGGECNEQGSLFDIEFINSLDEQITDIVNERERKAKAAKYMAQGIALVSHSFSSGSEDGKPTKGIQFAVKNLTDKEIKYVIIEVVGYNSVDDPVWDYGYMKSLRGIGPIGAKGYGSWDFDNVWKSNPSIVDSYEIKSMTAVFMNGGSKKIKLPRTLPSDWRNWLY